MFEKEFLNYLHSGLYNEAKALIKDISFNELYDFVLKASFKTGLLTPYNFLIFMLIEKESAQIHHGASVIMSTALSHIEGAFSVALLHARRAVSLEPGVVTHKEWLLSFYNIPDQVMHEQEAKEIAEAILCQDSTSVIALSVIKKIDLGF